jgi:hypothetical protein
MKRGVIGGGCDIASGKISLVIRRSDPSDGRIFPDMNGGESRDMKHHEKVGIYKFVPPYTWRRMD